MKMRIPSLCLAAALLLSPLSPAALAAGDSSVTADEWEVLRLTNRHRMDIGLKPLSTTDDMQMAANQRASELLTTYNSAHTRPDGSECFTVFNEFDPGPWSMAAENIAYGYPTPAEVVDGWLNSPGHRSNIEEADLTHLGVGSASWYWSQDFIGADCSYSELSLSADAAAGAVGCPLEDLLAQADIAVTAQCSLHGSSRLPLIAGMCSGYDPNAAGAQTVTVELGSAEAALTVTLEEQPPAEDAAPSDQAPPFSDTVGHWASEGIAFVYENGLLTGDGNGHFLPEVPMDRAMAVTVLARCSGIDTSTGSTWYEAGRAWAMENGISDGSGMWDPIAREDLATMLYRLSGSPDVSGDLSFSDEARISPYARQAVLWAVQSGLLTGRPNGLMDPRGGATRAEVATIIMRWYQLP